MAIKFGMPSLGHTMEKGKIIEWLRHEGDTVAKGEPLLVVETDKVVTEVEAPADGVVVKILVPADEERPIGAALAVLGLPGETLSDAEIQQFLGDEAAIPAAPPAHSGPAVLPSAKPAGSTATGTRTRLKISPVARKLAEEHQLDPATVPGTGPGGRITKDDILQAVAASRAAPAAAPVAEQPGGGVQIIPLRGIRGRVAERMYQSWNTIPRVTEVVEVDMSATVAFREAMLPQWESEYGLRISLNDLLTKAVAVALRRHPRLNATLVDQEVRRHEAVHVGVAVNLDEGLIVPVIRHTDTKTLGQIAQESRELADKARTGSLQLDDISDGTFTITNLGATGVDFFTPIINPPQVAILGVGAMQPRPIVVRDALAIRPSIYLCLVFDHRALDGVPAARFLQELQRLLSKPQDYAL